MGASGRSASFSLSGLVHGCVLGWVAFGPAPGPPEPRRSIYEELIQPHADRIVWYKPQDKLPDISPSGSADRVVPPRAARKAVQSMVAGAKDDSSAPQIIWKPEAEM